MSKFEGLDDYKGLMNIIKDVETNPANSLAYWIYENVKPTSVVDIGCGPGIYILPLMIAGLDCLGVDAEETAGDMIGDNFQRVDLRYPWKPDKVYDLGLCMEVAEHLKPEFADQLVENVVGACNQVIFTAARPGQGGLFHWNEQPREYWLDKFAKYGFELQPVSINLANEMSTNPVYACVPWLIHNTMFIARQ